MNILLLGGSGVFGRRLAAQLAQMPDVVLLLSSRRLETAQAAVANVGGGARAVVVNTDAPDWATLLRAEKIDLVINLSGPFQGQDYRVPRACLLAGCHYIDLADARAYVTGFADALDGVARAQGRVALTGASTVPAVAAAVIDAFCARDFAHLTTLDYGVSPGNRTERGTATVAAILSYVGERFLTLRDGRMQPVYGWQGLHRVAYPGLGKRWMSACDIPDLDLFPVRYPSLHTLRFSAGLELSALHLGLWGLSWLRRGRLLPNLAPWAALLRGISLGLLPFGSRNGGMHIRMTGVDAAGHPLTRTWFLIARQGDGPVVPVSPALVLIDRLRRGEALPVGAVPAAGCVTHAELSAIWKRFAIEEITV
jgi:hypothetical protein